MIKPKCPICKKEMINTIDNITKELSSYLWVTNCEHGKGIIMCRG